MISRFVFSEVIIMMMRNINLSRVYGDLRWFAFSREPGWDVIDSLLI